MIRIHKEKQNIIYTFKKQIISKNEDEKDVKDVYYMTHHAQMMCAYLSFKNGQILITLFF
jgi:hypothetical protein